MATVWRRDERGWEAMGPGVEHMELHRHAEGGGAALFRMVAGAVMLEHDHLRGEHTYVIEGELEMGGVVVRAGDALWTEPGERHQVRAITDALFLGVAPPKRLSAEG
jgi:quercetin dioxygenase-like cupin family protein